MNCVCLAWLLIRKLKLGNFPGENESGFAIVALKMTKIMNMGYVVDIQIGSGLLKKVDITAPRAGYSEEDGASPRVPSIIPN